MTSPCVMAAMSRNDPCGHHGQRAISRPKTRLSRHAQLQRAQPGQVPRSDERLDVPGPDPALVHVEVEDVGQLGGRRQRPHAGADMFPEGRERVEVAAVQLFGPQAQGRDQARHRGRLPEGLGPGEEFFNVAVRPSGEAAHAGHEAAHRQRQRLKPGRAVGGRERRAGNAWLGG